MNATAVIAQGFRFHGQGRIDPRLLSALNSDVPTADACKLIVDDNGRRVFSEAFAINLFGGKEKSLSKALTIPQLVEGCRRDMLSKDTNNVCWVINDRKAFFLQLVLVQHSKHGLIWLAGDTRQEKSTWFSHGSFLIYKAPKILVKHTPPQHEPDGASPIPSARPKRK